MNVTKNYAFWLIIALPFMSQHYLKYHFKNFICTNNNNKAVSEDETNGNGKDIEIDVINGNGRRFNNTTNNNCNNNNNNNSSVIRITENPLN